MCSFSDSEIFPEVVSDHTPLCLCYEHCWELQNKDSLDLNISNMSCPVRNEISALKILLLLVPKSGKEKENTFHITGTPHSQPFYHGCCFPQTVRWLGHKKGNSHNNSSFAEPSANHYSINSEQEQELKPTNPVPLTAVLSNLWK